MLAIVISEKEKIRKEVVKLLKEYEVVECKDILEAVSTVSQKNRECSMVVADYRLSPYSGVEVLSIVKKMKQAIRTVLLVSREDEEAEVEGLRKEIDLVMDYEKTETVNRAYIDRLLEQRVEPPVYVRGMELMVNGKAVELSRIDFQIVSLLIERTNEVVRREEILERIWGQTDEPVRKVAMHVRAIRKRLEEEGISNCVVTVSGEGYKWVYSQVFYGIT